MLLVAPPALRLFRREYPQVRVRLVEVLYPEVQDALRQGVLDFAIGPLPEEGLDDGFRTEVLFESELVIAAGTGHPSGGARSLRTLRDKDWVIAGPLTGPGAIIERTFLAHGFEAPQCVIHCASAIVATEVIAHSDMLTMIPLRLVEQSRVHRQIRVVRVRESLPRADISLILRERSILTPAAQALVSAIRLYGQKLGRSVRAR
jgi:DNA-binding transcriptional LysR family regulator